jgi:hypothetical protein
LKSIDEKAYIGAQKITTFSCLDGSDSKSRSPSDKKYFFHKDLHE